MRAAVPGDSTISSLSIFHNSPVLRLLNSRHYRLSTGRPRRRLIDPSRPSLGEFDNYNKQGKTKRVQQQTYIFLCTTPRTDKPVFLTDPTRQILPQAVSRHFAHSFEVLRRHRYGPQYSVLVRTTHVARPSVLQRGNQNARYVGFRDKEAARRTCVWSDFPWGTVKGKMVVWSFVYVCISYFAKCLKNRMLLICPHGTMR